MEHDNLEADHQENQGVHHQLAAHIPGGNPHPHQELQEGVHIPNPFFDHQADPFFDHQADPFFDHPAVHPHQHQELQEGVHIPDPFFDHPAPGENPHPHQEAQGVHIPFFDHPAAAANIPGENPHPLQGVNIPDPFIDHPAPAAANIPGENPHPLQGEIHIPHPLDMFHQPVNIIHNPDLNLFDQPAIIQADLHHNPDQVVVAPFVNVFNDMQYTKRLTASDVNQSSRLLLQKQFVEVNIMPFLNDFQRSRLLAVNQEIRINVFDVDRLSFHQLSLKRWITNSFVLTTNWTRDFVTRRHLMEGMRVGLSWSAALDMLMFSVQPPEVQVQEPDH